MSRDRLAAARRASAFSSSTVAAPTRQREQQQAAQAEGEGQRRAADEDVVGASRAARARGQQAQAAITSRWKCIVPLGSPVVPEVKAIRQVSSAAVSTLSNVAGLARARASSCRRRVPLKCSTCVSVGHCGCGRAQLAGQARVAQRVRDLRLVDDRRQLLARAAAAWCRPRCRRPSPPRTSRPPASGCWRRAAARGCRAPGPCLRPARARCGWPAPAARRRSSARRRASMQGRSPRRAATARSSSSAAQFRRGGNCSSGSSNRNSGHCSRRRQVVAGEGVDVRRCGSPWCSASGIPR